MPSTPRRTFLVASAALFAGGAGCLSGTPSDETDASPTDSDEPTATDVRSPTSTATESAQTTPDVEVPDAGECDPVAPPQPTPTAEFDPMSYPEFPSTFDRSSVVEFVEAWETAYQHNRYLEDPTPTTDSLRVSAGVATQDVHELDGAFAVGVNGRVETADESTPTDTRTAGPTGHYPFAAWYYVTDRVVMRAADEDATIEKLRSNSLEGAEVVACGD